MVVKTTEVNHKEVEELISKPLEAKLWEIPGVEDVYSVSMNSLSIVTATILAE